MERGIDPFSATVNNIIVYLQFRFDQGIKPSTLTVYCNSLGVRRGKADGFSVVSHPDIKLFLKGARRLRPPVKDIMPRWQLPLVLQALMEAPYEPAEKASLEAWTKKTLFLVAITSAARTCELQAIDRRKCLSIISKYKASLKLNPAFIPKSMMKDEYYDRTIELEAFFPNPDKDSSLERNWHTICPVRALTWYIHKTEPFRIKDQFQMFVSYDKRTLGQPVSRNTIAKWLIQVISNAYLHFEREVPEGIKAHSTRAVATSMATLSGVSIADVCRAATWSSSYIFARHYQLDVVPKDAPLMSTKILKGALKDVNPR